MAEDDCLVVNVTLDAGSDDIMEIPLEPDETLLLSTLQGQYPNAMGLKFKAPSGAWRAVRIVGDSLNPPNNGWGDTTYIVTINKESIKRKAEEAPEEPVSKAKKEATPEPKKEEPKKEEPKKEVPAVEPKKVEVQLGVPAKSEKYLLQDLGVFGIPFNYTDKELREYFNKNCGELSYCVIKFDRNTKKSRGFGFIRFKTVEGAKKALAGPHKMAGREVSVQLKKEEPFKIFVGKIRETTTSGELKEYFCQFGEITDVYIPAPFRGYAFVTFMYKDEGRLALDKSHVLKGARLNVSFAEPKEEKEARLRLEKLEEERRAEREFLLRGGAEAIPGNAAEDTNFFDLRRNMGRRDYQQARAEEYLGPGRGDGGYGLNAMGVRDVRDTDAMRGPMDGLGRGVRGPLDGGMRGGPRDMRGGPRGMRGGPLDMRGGSRDIGGPRDMGSDRDSFNLLRNLKEANDRFSPRGPQRNFQTPLDQNIGLQNMLVSLLSNNVNY